MLVIEDNSTNLDLMVYLLSSFGHRTLSAATGEDGIVVAMRERPDLVICDIHLPQMSGFDVVRSLKATDELSSVPVIAVTAFAMVGDRQAVLAAGFDGYITKPIDPEAFVGQVESFLPKGGPSDREASRPSAERDDARVIEH
jgi:CheY-like chemotaxis protein